MNILLGSLIELEYRGPGEEIVPYYFLRASDAGIEVSNFRKYSELEGMKDSLVCGIHQTKIVLYKNIKRIVVHKKDKSIQKS